MTTRTRIATGEADAGRRAADGLGPGRLGRLRAAWSSGWASPMRRLGGVLCRLVCARRPARQTPDTLELSLDKPAYTPGDTAKLRIVPRYGGHGAGDGAVEPADLRARRSRCRRASTVIPVPVTDDWGAGAYVTASVIRPMDVAAGHNPARALGLAYAKVDPGRTAACAPRSKRRTRPRRAAPLDVAVKVDGRAAGRHRLCHACRCRCRHPEPHRRSRRPIPRDHYFGQRKLGVGIRDLYGRLIDGMNGAMGAVRSGGDAAAQARAAWRRRRPRSWSPSSRARSTVGADGHGPCQLRPARRSTAPCG